MKIYEAITKNKTEIQSDDFLEDSYLNIKWRSIVRLPVWVPLTITGILFVSFIPKLLLKAFLNIVHRVFRTLDRKTRENAQVEPIPTPMETTKRACDHMKKTLKKPTFICKTNEFNEIFFSEERHLPAEKLHRIVLNVRQENLEFSRAYRYLCTCLPENRIMSRKPIRLS